MPAANAHADQLRTSVRVATATLLLWCCALLLLTGNVWADEGSVLVVPERNSAVGTGVQRASAAEAEFFQAEPLPIEDWPGDVSQLQPFAEHRQQHLHHGDECYYGPEHLYHALGLPIVIEVPAWAIPEPPLYHRNANDPYRHHGIGSPLHGTSWLNRPLSVGWFFGGLFADGPISGVAKHDHDMFGGYKFGWDFDHYWGTEVRLGFSHLPVEDYQGQVLPRDSRTWFYDVHLLHYPWGDARWRPYWSIGMGFSTWDLDGPLGRHYSESLFQIPLAVGVKYQWTKWLTFRLDAADNIAFGNGGLDTMHNFSLTFGAEIRFGGWRRGYYPWNPSVHMW